MSNEVISVKHILYLLRLILIGTRDTAAVALHYLVHVVKCKRVPLYRRRCLNTLHQRNVIQLDLLLRAQRYPGQMLAL